MSSQALQQLPAPDRAGAPDPGGEGSHVTALDGIRGFAILSVLLDHYFYGDVRNIRAVDLFYHVCSAGWMGVDLFFVLSGFLITGILLRAKQRQHYFRNFYARRILRIVPLYVGFLFLGWCLLRLGSTMGKVWPGQSGQGAVWLWTYLANYRLAYLGQVVPFRIGPFDYTHFWSLAVEEHFYLVWPAVVLLCPRRRLIWICAAVTVACLAGRILYFHKTGRLMPLYFATHFRLDGLFTGSAAAIAIRESRFRAIIHRYATAGVLAAAASVVVIYLFTGWRGNNAFVSTGGFTIIALCSVVLVLGACVVQPSHPLRRVTEWAPLRTMGRYSYGIYVTHMAVLFLLGDGLTAAAYGVTHSRTLSDLLGKAATMACAVAVAWAIYHGYERPFLRLKRFFPSPAAIDVRVLTAEAGPLG